MYVVTGVAGFIGSHLVQRLLADGKQVIGIDNVNDYYDVSLKQARLKQLPDTDDFTFIQADISEPEGLMKLCQPYQEQITHVIHLAAQAGVRYSLEAPRSYVTSNVAGQLEVLECCRNLPKLKHLVYASSSSVYGANRDLPFSVNQRTDHPVSLYAATKKSGEMLAESYARLYDLPITGLRFFTVYGPWGRPDMAYFKFTQRILKGETIQIYNQGNMRRDFTYIDDVVAGICQVMDHAPTEVAPHPIYNLGNHQSEKLMDMIGYLEEYLGREAKKEFLPMQPGDVEQTYADIEASQRDFGFAPQTSLKDGLKAFVDWYKDYYKA